ncbi:restriction endonuclease [Streptomyces sp. LP11]|uniref:Restriction endonuclease n=1 Tax=Streptomyces pyxinicus TaxID=2970331 RepID=A0ABT2AZ46_9ACTN|nr:restriction endonuclease [Streptomyces sp. LP11]MCS0601521.1 restriction endonuclease [Streptomyces sp. LP11]
MSRRSAGFVNTWAEVQRAQQRQVEAERRRRREEDRLARDYERRAAQGHREYRQAEARRRTEELDARVAELQGLLAEGCRAPAFRAASLMRVAEVPPFDPGGLAWPVRMPDQNQYRPQGGAWTAGRRAQAEAEARARFEHDWYQAQAAEAQRQQQLAALQREYEQRAEAQRSEVQRYNAGVSEAAAGVGRGEPELVVEYFSTALYASGAWPDGFPRRLAAAFDPAARQLVLNWELPGYDVVPEAKAVRYIPAQDQDKETARPVTQRRALYREVLAQSVLLVLHQLFAADEHGTLDSVALNGFVDAPDPATGRQTHIFLATVMARRADFTGFRLEQVDATSCLTEALRGQLATRPDQLTAVRPGRRPEEVGGQVVTHGEGGEEPDLYAMDPIEFESLVADLFRAMGMRAVTTQRSNDGGVDVDALDPAPIRGGKIVVQVKRYRNTVPPTAVRDLYGTVQDAGANKGVLVTTSGFGPGSHTFARGKPLELIEGGALVDLLHRHGLRGRLGEGGRPAPAPAGPEGAAAAPADHNVLGLMWSGTVALDVCALVCAGNRVLSDDHFVFFNNPRTPDGSVRTVSASAPDRAAVGVSFDTLPPGADRLVLVAAVDPETNPDADLSGFTDACIRLLDASLNDLGRLDVSDGRAGETALVLGSFRRRTNGDWDFVLGGKGYTGGLEELVRDYGIEVE